MNIPLGFCLLLLLAGCSGSMSSVHDYTNAQMDFSAVHTVAVLPFQNLSADDQAAERVRDVFMGMLLTTEQIYVLPTGEVKRGIALVGMRSPQTPTTEEITKLKNILKVDAVITGVLREYGTVRSGSAEANLVSLSLQMVETQNGTTVWSASSTKGGISMADRMLGSGGRPMNDVTTQVINDLLDQLFE
ncbi:GNA1162 family protein [Geopsychrobacter electrodiphilus]|uniref:GNA1162 family protein n=1 Tax=Geopsychrobacter electrodiphilus TaxID=225196 RepID=UPI00039A16D2|nr:GNA1162 family protein [Geopsychrobacter electrodiphilus]